MCMANPRATVIIQKVLNLVSTYADTLIDENTITISSKWLEPELNSREVANAIRYLGKEGLLTFTAEDLVDDEIAPYMRNFLDESMYPDLQSYISTFNHEDCKNPLLSKAITECECISWSLEKGESLATAIRNSLDNAIFRIQLSENFYELREKIFDNTDNEIVFRLYFGDDGRTLFVNGQPVQELREGLKPYEVMRNALSLRSSTRFKSSDVKSLSNGRGISQIMQNILNPELRDIFFKDIRRDGFIVRRQITQKMVREEKINTKRIRFAIDELNKSYMNNR